jgi:hypothetical protein
VAAAVEAAQDAARGHRLLEPLAARLGAAPGTSEATA